MSVIDLSRIPIGQRLSPGESTTMSGFEFIFRAYRSDALANVNMDLYRTMRSPKSIEFRSTIHIWVGRHSLAVSLRDLSNIPRGVAWVRVTEKEIKLPHGLSTRAGSGNTNMEVIMGNSTENVTQLNPGFRRLALIEIKRKDKTGEAPKDENGICNII